MNCKIFLIWVQYWTLWLSEPLFLPYCYYATCPFFKKWYLSLGVIFKSLKPRPDWSLRDLIKVFRSPFFSHISLPPPGTYWCTFLRGWRLWSGIVKEISLGPLYRPCCSCVIQSGLFDCALPARANEPRYSVGIGSLAPSLLRASKAGDTYLFPSSWRATRTILL